MESQLRRLRPEGRTPSFVMWFIYIGVLTEGKHGDVKIARL